MKSFVKNIIYNILYLGGIWNIKRFLNRRRVAILMYHGVIIKSSEFWTQINVMKFEAQMKFLRKKYTPISLTSALEILSGKTSPIKYPVVITFDDGFLNNLTDAYPILMKYNIPATIFLTVSLINKNSPYGGLLWPDYILGLLLGTDANSLDLFEFGLGKYSLNNREKRIYAKDEICRKLKKMDWNEKNMIIGKITERIGGNIDPGIGEMFAGLDWNQIQKMYAGGIINFGAHTINHEILSRLPESEMNSEIQGSKDIIEKETGITIKYFAYPNGTRDDFNDTAKGIVAQYFDCALTTIEGLNTVGDDLYELKRINIGGDMEMPGFKMSLCGL